jgi:hypothetical protein
MNKLALILLLYRSAGHGIIYAGALVFKKVSYLHFLNFFLRLLLKLAFQL